MFSGWGGLGRADRAGFSDHANCLTLNGRVFNNVGRHLTKENAPLRASSASVQDRKA
jgi:hypothetical protein